MAATMNFSKKAFSNKIEILGRDGALGYVNFSVFKTNAEGEFQNKKYLFKRKTFWSIDYNIYKADNEQLIGEVIFSAWTRKAEIILASGERFILKNKNIWGTQWRMDDANRQVAEFAQTKQFFNQEGTITTTVNDSEKMGLLVLLGLFVNQMFRRRASEGA